MRIGDLAEATGTPVETIRFYEREGLIAPPRRSDNNYRMYQPAHAERLAFIRQCRSLDMALDEVRALQKPAAKTTCANWNICKKSRRTWKAAGPRGNTLLRWTRRTNAS